MGKTLLAKTSATIVAVTFLFVSCQKNDHSLQPLSSDSNKMGKDLSENLNAGKKIGHFTQTNLVSDVTGWAPHIDPTLVNAWGLAWSPSGIAWIGSQGGHVSNVYNNAGTTVLGPVNIPSPGGTTGGNPTGVVFNPSSGFLLSTGGPARFIFVGVDGVVSAWNGSKGVNAQRITTVPQSAFTGLALAHNGTDTMIYAANFRGGKINVWSKTWTEVSLPFSDPMIPAGYSPFNIQNVGNMLYVTYAKVGPNGRSQAGDGLGYVDIYWPNGTLSKRFASKGSLNAPWGVTMAPAGYLPMDDDETDAAAQPTILVGNFG
ncbi:MAG TPA: TIGR03118 family protein, partial [Flavisolibacter sp.]